jgi:4'-phosphopantetheinyl transferase
VHEKGQVDQIGSNRQISDVASSKLVPPVVIWFRLTQSMSAQDIEEARSVLSLEERARADRFVFERDRRDFIAAHALLRGVLSHHSDLPHDRWQFESEAAGKPFLAGQSELQFNIAHTRGLVACALSLAGPVGIDVESIESERDIESISESYFAQTEVIELKACEEGLHRQARFIELWTLKEAYLKALGAGLGRPLDEIAFHFVGESDLRGFAQDNSTHVGWRFSLFAPLDNYRLAVAVRTNTNFAFHARQWPDDRDQCSLFPIRSSELSSFP